jgi:putative sigma-54 modulation protein
MEKKVNVNAVHFRADSKLVQFIESKFERLGRLFDRVIDVDVHLKLQDTGSRVQEKIAEIRVHLPGGWLVDRKTGRTFESAVNASIDTVKRQLVRQKERASSTHGRGRKPNLSQE